MRLKKSLVNSSVGIISYLISFLPIFLVRKVFLDTLGAELLGLNSLYTNIVGYLSIVEMGIGSAIIYALYKPYSDGDKVKVKGYLNYYKKFYFIVGSLILIIGLLITPFLNLFVSGNTDLLYVRIGFILFLINTFIGYIFTYKHCLLNVAQENYKISIGISLSKLTTALLQIIVLYVYEDFYIYSLIQIFINMIFYIIINNHIKKEFSWLQEINGNLDIKEKRDLLKNIKALFMHKIGEIFVFGTDNLVVAGFLDLATVAIYNNYIILTSAFSTLMRQAMNGITSSIGNLLAEKDSESSYVVHKRLFFVIFWITSFVVISLNNTISQFIALWVGDKYVLDVFTVSLILINLYFQMMRSAVGEFKSASGEYYKDRYAPLVEGIINLACSIILVKLIGLSGVFLGTLISNITVIFWIQPKIVYKYVFKKPLSHYFKLYFKYLAITLGLVFLTGICTATIKYEVSIQSFIFNCVLNCLIVNGVYTLIFWRTEEFKYFKDILIEILSKRKLNKAKKG